MKIRRHQNNNTLEYSTTDDKLISELMPIAKPGITDFLSISIDAQERKSLISIEFDRDDLHHFSQGLLEHYKELVDKYEKTLSELSLYFDLFSYNNVEKKVLQEILIELKDDKNIQKYDVNINIIQYLNEKVGEINYIDGLKLLRNTFSRRKQINSIIPRFQYDENAIFLMLSTLPLLQKKIYFCKDSNNVYKLPFKDTEEDELLEYFIGNFRVAIIDFELHERHFITENIKSELMSLENILTLVVDFIISLPDEEDAYYDYFHNENE